MPPDEPFGDEWTREGAPRAGEINPSHLWALADRIQKLAAVLDIVRQKGDGRDVALAQINLKIDNLKAEVDGILRSGGRFTDEQIKTLEEIILGRDRSRWLWARSKVWVGYITATILFVWSGAAQAFFKWAATLLGGAP